MTIASEITRLQNDKAAMCAAIENKGVTVGNVTLDDYACCIDAIQAGGGSCFVELFMIGGGGGGGVGYGSGGGGAGGVILGKFQVGQTTKVKAGAGGNNSNGSPSCFCSEYKLVMACGGGRGGVTTNTACRIPGCDGGSGGGAGGRGPVVANNIFCNEGGKGLDNNQIQGQPGGASISCGAPATGYSGGGGGGVGGPGGMGFFCKAGDGGPGVVTSFECGVGVAYAGGGGGSGYSNTCCTSGAGGSGGGGAGGGYSKAGCNATCYGGGGGGSGGSSYCGGYGYQGVVMIRYPKDGSYGFSDATGGTKSEITDGGITYCIHKFTSTSESTFCIVS